VVAILKMASGRNYSMSGIISGHHNLPTYEMRKKDVKYKCDERTKDDKFGLFSIKKI
jgi:hypothetical protein